MIKNAWICDDAYITFRTVDNFLHGLGLTWNPDERVQTYTHPLWMLVISLARLLTGKIYYSTIFISLLFTLAAVMLTAAKIARNHFAAVAVVLLLSFSKAFVDFSTSGLENPLTYLCLAIFFTIYWQLTMDLKTFFWLCLTAGLGIFNRLDTILLFIPALTAAAWQLRSQWGWRLLLVAMAGFSPWLLWEAFSLGYYGFLFPNTAYAKLNTGVPGPQLLESGLNYIFNSLQMDPVTWVIIATAIVAAFLNKGKNALPAALGILLYLVYIVKIGGDFMSGRYFAAPVLCAVAILARTLPWSLSGSVLATALILLLGIFSPYNPWASDAGYRQIQFNTVEEWNHYTWSYLIDENGIADERAYYYPVTGLLKVGREGEFDLSSQHPLINLLGQGRELAGENKRRILVGGCAGIEGYYAGPKIHFLDFFALGDPLLARLPAKPNCRTGHYEREIPAGYIESLVSGRNEIKYPKIAGLYNKLTNIIQGPLFRWTRFADIIQLNFGSLLPPGKSGE